MCVAPLQALQVTLARPSHAPGHNFKTFSLFALSVCLQTSLFLRLPAHTGQHISSQRCSEPLVLLLPDCTQGGRQRFIGRGRFKVRLKADRDYRGTWCRELAGTVTKKTVDGYSIDTTSTTWLYWTYFQHAQNLVDVQGAKPLLLNWLLIGTPATRSPATTTEGISAIYMSSFDCLHCTAPVVVYPGVYWLFSVRGALYYLRNVWWMTWPNTYVAYSSILLNEQQLW